jgi:hypothetical protein
MDGVALLDDLLGLVAGGRGGEVEVAGLLALLLLAGVDQRDQLAPALLLRLVVASLLLNAQELRLLRTLLLQHRGRFNHSVIGGVRIVPRLAPRTLHSLQLPALLLQALLFLVGTHR